MMQLYLYHLQQHVSPNNPVIFMVMFLIQEYNCSQMCHNHPIILKYIISI